MEFEVRFVSDHDYAVNVYDADTGMDGVRRIRQQLKLPELSLEKIGPKKAGRMSDPALTVPEDVATRSGLFKTVNSVKVHCTKGVLNAVVSETVHVNRSKTTDEIESVYIKSVINHEMILPLWEEAGFPISWGIPD